MDQKTYAKQAATRIVAAIVVVLSATSIQNSAWGDSDEVSADLYTLLNWQTAADPVTATPPVVGTPVIPRAVAPQSPARELTQATPRWSDPIAGRRASGASSAHSRRIYYTPDMLSNFYPSGAIATIDGAHLSWPIVVPGASFLGYWAHGDAILLPSGGAGRLSVADNNKAVTQDRAYFQYNHFHNIGFVDASASYYVDPLPDGQEWAYSKTPSVDRFLLGGEKSFADGLFSFEVRLPMTTHDGDFSLFQTDCENGQMGDLSLIFKTMLAESETTAWATGLGLELPTGSESTTQILDTRFTWRNETVSLVPYLAVTTAPTERLFANSFLQLNIPVTGSPLAYSDPNVGYGTSEAYHEPILLLANLGTGCWLRRTGQGQALRGIAAMFELHCTTRLDTPDSVQASVGFQGSDEGYRYSVYLDPTWQHTLVDATIGTHVELGGGWRCRGGVSLPLLDNRSFDFEAVAQVEKGF